jgi:hypothetical protein
LFSGDPRSGISPKGSRRTAIERLFFRLDHLRGMERQTACGLARVRVGVTPALAAMLATAAAWIELGRAELIRSRLQAAPAPRTPRLNPF